MDDELQILENRDVKIPYPLSIRDSFNLSLTIGIAVCCCLLLGCSKHSNDPPSDAREVVVYTALDQIYSEPILKAFESREGIRVRVVYDSEAAKTVGLVNRLIAERARPRCDVFWNNEIIRTIKLDREGLLETYDSPMRMEIPAAFKDNEGRWTGFAARARVLAFNTKLLTRADAPKSLDELTDPKWSGQVGMAYPLFGSTATHAAALFARWGEKRVSDFFSALKANRVHIYDGNMGVCRAVASGEIAMGLTDTDDAHLVQSEGKPLDFILLDHDGEGAVLIPNTLALVKGAPHGESARKLMDYLLSAEVEESLAKCESAQIPVRSTVPAPDDVAAMAKAKFMSVNFTEAERQIESSAEILKRIFSKP